MCNNNNNETGACKCLAEILEVIVLLQRNAERGDSCLDVCDRGFLGNSTVTCGFNTRPVQLYTCCGNGSPWRMPISKTAEEDEQQQRSSVFRCEKVDGCCATFRVLASNPDTVEAINIPYVATNSFFTMNLACCCSIKCLPDTHIECL